MNRLAVLFFALCSSLCAQDKIQTKTTYAKAYGETKNAVAVDPGKDLPRYPAVEPKDAIATWQVKKGFKLQLAAHEPQVRDPIAICFDENGRMFVCEMHDYSEMRDVTPHLGRISMLEDKDGDGYYETSQIFADDLPWPTGLIWANGGLYVGATPDIWRFEDKDGDGRAEVREKVFTGFGTGLKILNVQGLMNSFQWGQDNRIHVLAGGGNRGVIRRVGVPPASGKSGILPDRASKMPATPASGETPDLQGGIELGGKDFWFNPLTHEFGLEGGGAQYGMSFDNYGRKFGCSNSDHLQYWVYDDKYANRNPYYQMPPARQSIAVDGGAAEVFRISPDEPWRIIRTRWRIAGVVKGAVEGGGRVSGYLTGATGTTIYRGDAYGPEFVNNSFTGDAGGQLVHRKIIKPSADGISLIGERPADEHGFEFAASKDTWVRTVNFANAPDGCLHICDMYREVIEHPWSIPDEIKKHIDLNSGNDRGRIYRIVPDKGVERIGQKVALGKASTEELVKTLSHPNGWHRDAAQRLLFERQDKAAVPLLEKVLETKSDGILPSTDGKMPSLLDTTALAKLHALGALNGLAALTDKIIIQSLVSSDEVCRERGILLLTSFCLGENTERLTERGKDLLASYAVNCRPFYWDDSKRVAFSWCLLLSRVAVYLPEIDGRHEWALTECAGMLNHFSGQADVEKALLSGDAELALPLLKHVLKKRKPIKGDISPGAELALLEISATAGDQNQLQELMDLIQSGAFRSVGVVQAFARGLKKQGRKIEEVDKTGKLAPRFKQAVDLAKDSNRVEQLDSIELLGLTSSKEAFDALIHCLGAKQPDIVQSAAIRVLAQNGAESVTAALISNWPHYGAKSKAAALEALLAREDRAAALLKSNVVKPEEFSASQVQALIKHKSPKVAATAKTALVSVIPPSREEVAAKFKPAIAAKGDAAKGQAQFMARCVACHKAGTIGLPVGPDLITVKIKGREALLEAILQPHKEVASQFIAYTVNTKDGQTFAGIITNDTASSMTIKMMGGVDKTLQRAEIKGSSSTGQSLMPEGLETGMSVEDMADLLSFIEGL